MTEQTSRPRPGKERPRAAGAGARTDAAAGGLIAEVIPLVRDGLVVLRTLLDLAIQRLDEIEEGRTAYTRRETYETILAVLDDEIERLHAEPASEAVDAQLDALRSIRQVLERQLRHTAEPPKPSNGTEGTGGAPKPHARTVSID